MDQTLALAGISEMFVTNGSYIAVILVLENFSCHERIISL